MCAWLKVFVHRVPEHAMIDSVVTVGDEIAERDRLDASDDAGKDERITSFKPSQRLAEYLEAALEDRLQIAVFNQIREA